MSTNTNITLRINGEDRSYPKSVLLYDVAKDYQNDFNFPILAALVDNDMVDLSKKMEVDAEVSFVDMSSRIGYGVYQKGLIFLLVYAVKVLYGKKCQLRVGHSIDKGIMITSKFKIDSSILEKIKEVMKDVVSKKIEFKKCLVNKKEADKYFASNNEFAKVKSLKYLPNNYINLYRLGDMYEYLYSVLPYDTSVFFDFDLYLLNDNEFVLQFPTIADNFTIPEYKDWPKIMKAYEESYDFARRLNVLNVADLNFAVSSGRINDVIRLSEVVSDSNLLDLAKSICDKKDEIKLILIAGPSSSGKTTTARKLSLLLKSFGVNPTPLSIDDYFLERDETPKLENGKYDYESIKSIDLELFHNHLEKILNGEEVLIPTYNFQSGKKEYVGHKIKLDSDDILIVEGLHGLNEELTSNIAKEKKIKVYVSPLINLNVDDYNMVSTSDVRLLRRIVRDNYSRGYSASETINSFEEVRAGEEVNVFPYQGDADYVYNSGFIYEIGVLKLYALPLLYAIDSSDQSYCIARRLIRFLNMFLSISADEIPTDSILREFIGNSYFEGR